MPELFSRMDNLHWLTPSIADILDQGSTPPGGDGSIRERMLMIQRELDELDTPARIVNVRSTPSYTLYIARPESVGRIGNRHTVSPNEIKQSIKQIAENHEDWLLGFIPRLREDDSAVGILLRTEEHRPMSLRRLLVRSAFRQHPSTLAFVLGITLEQQLIVDSIDNIGHLLIIGDDNAKQHFIRSTLLTLIMLNTPAELRVAIAGESSDAYKYVVGAPHALGRILTSPGEGQRLIDGLVKEIQRRQQSLKDEVASNIAEYNEKVKNVGRSELPRIVLILDSLTDESWQPEAQRWFKPLSELLTNGADVGIHLVIAVDDEAHLDLPKHVLHALPLKVVTRSSSKDISTGIPDFHASLLRFVDAFVFGVENKKDREITPVELCAISNSEIKNVVEYWRQMSKQRYQDMQAKKSGSKTGVTGVLTASDDTETPSTTPPSPPTPEKPSASTLVRATQALGTHSAVTVQEDTPTQEMQEAPVKVFETRSRPIDQTQEVVSNREETTVSNDASTVLSQAIALSAYLGWISKGALCDVLNIPDSKAVEIIAELQKQNIVETADHPTLRFIRAGRSKNGTD